VLTRSSGMHFVRHPLIRCLTPEVDDDTTSATEQRLVSIEDHLNDMQTRFDDLSDRFDDLGLVNSTVGFAVLSNSFTDW